jgi:hypothetical protein
VGTRDYRSISRSDRVFVSAHIELAARIAAQPDLTLAELRDALGARQSRRPQTTGGSRDD